MTRSARRRCACCAPATSQPRPRRSPIPEPTRRKLAFAGTPDVAARTLEALVDAGHEIRCCVTRADSRRGRRESPSPSPVKAVALARGLPVATDVGAITTSGAQLGVVVAYGRLIPAAVFSVVPLINVHFSLLPRWRGAAPVERAILAGDETTGVCLMEIEEGLDTGPIYARREVRIGGEETATELEDRLGAIGTAMLLELLARPGDLPAPMPQSGEATLARKISKDERRLDFFRSAGELARIVRVGGAWTTFRNRRLIIRRATARPGAPVADRPGVIVGDLVQCGDGALELVEVQSEGRATLAFRAWAGGVRLAANEVLGGVTGIDP